MRNKGISLAAIILLGIASAFLTFLAFEKGIGDLNRLSPVYGNQVKYLIAVFLAVGFVLVEYKINADIAHGTLNSQYLRFIIYPLIGVFAYINVGSGSFRLNDNVRESSNQARMQVTEDPRWIEYQKELDAQYGMLNNGTYKDDATANARIVDIKTKMDYLTQEYKQSSSSINAANASLFDLAFNSYMFFIVAFLSITFAFGYMVQSFEKASLVGNKTPITKVDKVEPPKTVTKEKIDNLRKKESNAAPEIRRLLKNPDYQHPDGKPIVTKIAEKVGRSRETVYNVMKSKGR